MNGSSPPTWLVFSFIVKLSTDNWPSSLSVSDPNKVNCSRPSFLLSITFQKFESITYSLTYRFTCDEHRAVVTTERRRRTLKIHLQSVVEKNGKLGKAFPLFWVKFRKNVIPAAKYDRLHRFPRQYMRSCI